MQVLACQYWLFYGHYLCLLFFLSFSWKVMFWIKTLRLAIKNHSLYPYKANIISTIIGLPLAWVACFIMEILLLLFFTAVAGAESYLSSLFKALPESISNILTVIITFPWLGPWREGDHWIIPFATSIMFVPCFFLSYWMELFYIGCG